MVFLQGITARAKHCDQNTKEEIRNAQKCEKTGYYLDLREPCESGHLPALNTEDWSVVCSQPGPLSDLIGVSSDLSLSYVDKTLE